MQGMSLVHRPGEHRLLVHPPGARGFVTSDGRWLQAPAIEHAFATGRVATLLRREQASQIGFEQRTAEAGLARVDAGPLGQWQIAVVASRARLRDREAHGQVRLLLGQLFTIGALLVLGGVALRAERRKLDALQQLAQAELQRERESQLDRENRAAAMITFAGGVAHEISSPLGVIAGRAEQLAARAANDARSERAVQVILKEVDYIRQVIQGFLELARGDAPPLARVSPEDVVKRAVALCEHRFASAGVRLEADAARDLPSVRGDARLLDQALVNLLLNACDACAGGGTVRVAAGLEDGHVRFTVTDNGTGISPTAAARAVEPFFTTKRAGQGTGLGLAITNEIMKVHRGDLALAPRDGGGTIATIQVPIATDDVDAVA
jgi:signal transduction histidine kinase